MREREREIIHKHIYYDMYVYMVDKKGKRIPTKNAHGSTDHSARAEKSIRVDHTS